MTIAMITGCLKGLFSIIGELLSLIVFFANKTTAPFLKIFQFIFAKPANNFPATINDNTNKSNHLLQNMWFGFFNIPHQYEIVINRTRGTANNFCHNVAIKKSTVRL
jgi:hypothetical protein